MTILEILHKHVHSTRERTVMDTDAQKLEYLRAIWSGRALVPAELANELIGDVLEAVDVMIIELSPALAKPTFPKRT